jgi:WD40 repeat protein
VNDLKREDVDLMTDTNEDFAMDSFDDSVMESDQSETEGKTLILMQDTQSDNDSFVDDKSNGITGSSYIDALPDQAFHTVTDANDSTCCLAFYTYDKNTSSYPITHSISLISVGSVDEKLRFYTVNDMGGISYVDQVSDFSDSVVSVQFSFDGKYLAAGSYDTTVKIFQINFKESNIDIQYKHQLHGPTSDIEWIAWHPRGYALLAGSNDATLWMWLANTSTVMQVFSGHVGSVLCGGFANQGRLVVSGNYSYFEKNKNWPFYIDLIKKYNCRGR